jgi:hypothetical protein
MKLIDGWSRKLHKLWTTRLAFAGAAVGMLADAFPQLQGVLPNKWYLAVFALIIVARVVVQEKLDA